MKIKETQPSYAVQQEIETKPVQPNFLDLVDTPAEKTDILTSVPLGLAGDVYASPMPFGTHDPNGDTYREFRHKDISVVVMLAEDQEAPEKSGRDLRAMYRQNGFEIVQLPIKDFSVPDRAALDEAVGLALEQARQGKNVVVHCSAGVGRTGLFMVELAKRARRFKGDSALYWVRLYLPGAVETEEQERFVLEG